MEISEDGRVAGSVDRAKLAELYQGTDDEELKAHYEQVDPGLKDYVDSLNAPPEAEAPAEAEAQAEPAEVTTTEAPEAPDLSGYTKAQLVEEAVARGWDRTEAEGKTKADLLAALGG